MKHIKSLDGLRGLSILLVILVHYHYLDIGWIGVEIFFVLSGFLITTILLEQKGLPFENYLKKFYWRRVLRIFPIYFSYLFILTIAYVIFKKPYLFNEQWPFLYSYTYNFSKIYYRGYFVNNYYGHLWSLSIEEQFYMVWPLLIFFLSEKNIKRVILAIIFICPVLRLVIGFYYLGDKYEFLGNTVYYLTFTQIDGLAAGASIAIFKLYEIKKPVKYFLFSLVITLFCGLIMVKVCENARNSFGYPGLLNKLFYQYVWGYSMINFVSATLILCLINEETFMAKIFENKYLVNIGKISYGMYIFHYPILGIINELIDFEPKSLKGLVIFIFYLAAVILISKFSFQYFELRFIRLKNKFNNKFPASRTLESISE
jgi:peptidoglycan/LPS O-acetylase OafA/YrhL